eukprot:TRINITY_DN7155_c0_g1_i1.p1 TRINITY_DN7155_c0_g1~~TRINITY_DN7155_c0_g1_i1.p1  ORF type:complete len:845 (-),score=129.52 TRINITY_DN7155_c0_g1_i1:97-2631(-)
MASFEDWPALPSKRHVSANPASSSSLAQIDKGEAVMGYFFGQWHPGTVRSASGGKVEVLWDTEYASSWLDAEHVKRAPPLRVGDLVTCQFYGEWHLATVRAIDGEHVDVLWQDEPTTSLLPCTAVKLAPCSSLADRLGGETRDPQTSPCVGSEESRDSESSEDIDVGCVLDATQPDERYAMSRGLIPDAHHRQKASVTAAERRQLKKQRAKKADPGLSRSSDRITSLNNQVSRPLSENDALTHESAAVKMENVMPDDLHNSEKKLAHSSAMECGESSRSRSSSAGKSKKQLKSSRRQHTSNNASASCKRKQPKKRVEVAANDKDLQVTTSDVCADKPAMQEGKQDDQCNQREASNELMHEKSDAAPIAAPVASPTAPGIFAKPVYKGARVNAQLHRLRRKLAEKKDSSTNEMEGKVDSTVASSVESAQATHVLKVQVQIEGISFSAKESTQNAEVLNPDKAITANADRPKIMQQTYNSCEARAVCETEKAEALRSSSEDALVSNETLTKPIETRLEDACNVVQKAEVLDANTNVTADAGSAKIVQQTHNSCEASPVCETEKAEALRCSIEGAPVSDESRAKPIDTRFQDACHVVQKAEVLDDHTNITADAESAKIVQQAHNSCEASPVCETEKAEALRCSIECVLVSDESRAKPIDTRLQDACNVVEKALDDAEASAEALRCSLERALVSAENRSDPIDTRVQDACNVVSQEGGHHMEKRAIYVDRNPSGELDSLAANRVQDDDASSESAVRTHESSVATYSVDFLEVCEQAQETQRTCDGNTSAGTMDENAEGSVSPRSSDPSQQEAKQEILETNLDLRPPPGPRIVTSTTNTPGCHNLCQLM